MFQNKKKIRKIQKNNPKSQKKIKLKITFNIFSNKSQKSNGFPT